MRFPTRKAVAEAGHDRAEQGQLTELAARAAAATGDVVKPGGRAAATGRYRPVAVVVALMRTNITQEMAGAVFGCSQATVSRRWDLPCPVTGHALASCVPEPGQILGAGTALADGTIAPTRDWTAIPDLFSGTAGSTRAAAGRAVASVKTWPIPSEDGGRCRAPISKHPEMFTAVIGLYFFSRYHNAL